MSQGGRQLIRYVTMGMIFGGVGLAGFGYYESTLPPEAATVRAFVQENSKILIGVGIAAIVLGAVVNFWAKQRMMKQMTAGMPGMGKGGMPDFSAMMGGMGAMGGTQREIVKVRCKSCNSLELEEAAFCSKCGKPMA